MIEAEHSSGVFDRNDKYLAAIRIAEKSGENNPRLHLALHDAAFQYAWRNRDLKRAEDFFKRDIVLLEKISTTFPDIVSDCYELADIYEWQGRYKEAEPLLLRAVAIRKKWEDLQSNDPFNAEIYTSLYILYYVQGNDSKAAEAKSQILTSLAQWHTDKTRAECLFKVDNDLYKYATRCKDLDPAKKKHLLEMALGFADQSVACERRCDGEWMGEVATINGAGIYMALGRFAEAERILRHALSFSEENLNDRKPYAFAALAQLATILCSQHRLNEVEQLQDDYLSKIAKQFGAKSETYIAAVSGCGESWNNEKYPERARTRWNQAQSIRESVSHNR
jgi:tetratricopeptide (TPR) repeat protein